MAVNGIEIKVDQVWRLRNGGQVTITSTEYDGRAQGRYPILASTGGAYTTEGRFSTIPIQDDAYDLTLLLSDADEKSPAPDPVPQGVGIDPANAVFPDIPETDRAVGKVTLSKCYLAERGAPTPEPSPDAPTLLDAAAGHMRDRAATYDKPEGERSMGKTVAIFNQFHGTALTEAQGWHMLQILKDVRLFANPQQPHRDSVEDCVAYAALKGEAFLKGGAQ